MRSLLIVLAAITVLALAPTGASAVTLDMPAGPTRDLYQGWADTADVPTISGIVKVHLHNCDKWQTAACTDSDAHPMIIVFPDLGYLFAPGFVDARLYQDQTSTHLNLIHELGHVLDFTLKDRGHYRERFMRILRLSSGLDGNRELSWDAAYNRNGDLVTPFEQFAMAYADCGVYPNGYPWSIMHITYPGFGFYPTASQYQRVCSLIRSL